ncbi:unnamed protein product [Gadus morhua 'NCC']
MASVLGNNSRASGAQSGQVKCKFKRRRRRRCKRKGFRVAAWDPSQGGGPRDIDGGKSRRRTRSRGPTLTPG